MSNKILITSIITASLCFFLQTPSYAGVYKWVDQDGQVHYSDQPINPDAEKVSIRKNDTTKPRAIKKDEKNADENTEGGDKLEDKNNEAKAEKPEKPAVSKKEKRRLCNEAKTDIASITSRGRTRELNAKGEYSYLSEKQRQQRLTAAKKKQREFCR